jgi:hypothetical protein
MKKTALTLIAVLTAGIVLPACKSKEPPPSQPPPATTSTYSYQSGK